MKVIIKQPDLAKCINAVNMLTVEAGTAVQKTAIQNAPRKTRVYLNSINYDGDKTITANARYSAAIEYGTKSHPIKVKNKQYLHFIGKDGKDVFKKEVLHPGTKPNPVMRMAARTVQKQIPELWENAQRKAGL